jgi:Mn-dependent DtxR family transcriptional regulator
VIRAVWELHDRGTATTVEAIAKYLEVPESEVREELNALKANRIFDQRMRKGKRVWLPWVEAH